MKRRPGRHGEGHLSNAPDVEKQELMAMRVAGRESPVDMDRSLGESYRERRTERVGLCHEYRMARVGYEPRPENRQLPPERSLAPWQRDTADGAGTQTPLYGSGAVLDVQR